MRIKFLKYLVYSVLLVALHISSTWALLKPDTISEISEDKTVIVLSIDGGGVRVIIPALVIQELEKQLGKSIIDVVDMLGGTSSGSLLAAYINIPDKNGKAKYVLNKKNSEELLVSKIKKVFQKSQVRDLKTLGGVLRSKFSAKPLEEVLQEVFGKERALLKTIKPMVLTTFDIANYRPFNFSTRKALSDSELNAPLWKIVRASTAAPTYFKPLDFEYKDEALVLVDGGLYAMSPELQAWNEAQLLYGKDNPNRKYIVISIGTGRDKTSPNVISKGVLAGGYLSAFNQDKTLQFVKEFILELPQKMIKSPLSTLKSVKEFISNVLSQLKESSSFVPLNAALYAQQSASQEILQSMNNVIYHRLDVSLPKKCASLSDASDENINCLKEYAGKIIEGDEFKKLLKDLKREIAKNDDSQEKKKDKKQTISDMKSSDEEDNDVGLKSKKGSQREQARSQDTFDINENDDENSPKEVADNTTIANEPDEKDNAFDSKKKKGSQLSDAIPAQGSDEEDDNEVMANQDSSPTQRKRSDSKRELTSDDMMPPPPPPPPAPPFAPGMIPPAPSSLPVQDNKDHRKKRSNAIAPQASAEMPGRSSSETTGPKMNDRNALLADIRNGVKLKPVDKNKTVASNSQDVKPKKSDENSLIKAALSGKFKNANEDADEDDEEDGDDW